MDKIFKIICIVIFILGGGISYLLSIFFDDEHEDLHSLIFQFCGAMCLITATLMSVYWI